MMDSNQMVQFLQQTKSKNDAIIKHITGSQIALIRVH